MNTEDIAVRLEEHLTRQARLGSADPVVEQVVDAIVGALRPALRQGVFELVEQAAAEIEAQLPGGRVEVVLSDGEPTLRFRSEPTEATFSTDDLEARMTVRLPTNLKAALEEAADDAGDSMNSFVIKTLAGGAAHSRKGRRVRETFRT
ncbi:MAG: toxin-antitoxin system HicB family antitoxin [Acidimicrobiia bacterium]|nr:toxin-antitoxin system HicB family antitoxin [Acidimicrobiia bacterium]